MTYKFRDGYRSSISAEIAGQELERIRRAEGHCQPETVVEAARPEDAPLHPAFEWNDSIAAEEHRKSQARAIIRSVIVVHQKADGSSVAVRGYLNVNLEGVGTTYVAAAQAMTDADLRAQVLADAIRGLEAWRQRFAELNDLTPELFAEIDRAVEIARQEEAARRAAAAKAKAKQAKRGRGRPAARA